jgi:hypothetical protein
VIACLPAAAAAAVLSLSPTPLFSAFFFCGLFSHEGSFCSSLFISSHFHFSFTILLLPRLYFLLRASSLLSWLVCVRQLCITSIRLFDILGPRFVAPHSPTNNEAHAQRTAGEQQQQDEEDASRVRIVISFNVMFLDDE